MKIAWASWTVTPSLLPPLEGTILIGWEVLCDGCLKASFWVLTADRAACSFSWVRSGNGTAWGALGSKLGKIRSSFTKPCHYYDGKVLADVTYGGFWPKPLG